MHLKFTRANAGENSTQGPLDVNGEFECYVLTLPVKDGLPGSCIPPGTYPVTLAPSPKFARAAEGDPTGWIARYADHIPHINDIPNRSNILIHWGNWPTDTDGCLLVGQVQKVDYVGKSRDAFSILHSKMLEAAVNKEPIEIEVV